MYRPGMNNKTFIGRFALWSIGIASLHFSLETLFTLRFGQSFVGRLSTQGCCPICNEIVLLALR
jgi:hypothetical protein